MSILLCCIRPPASTDNDCKEERGRCSLGERNSGSPHKARTGSSLDARTSTSLDNSGDESSAPRPLLTLGSLRERKAPPRLSEDTVISALSTTPTSLNPLAFFLPFGSDDVDEGSAGQPGMDASEFGSAQPQPPRSKVEFVDLCGSLEDLCYLGEVRCLKKCLALYLPDTSSSSVAFWRASALAAPADAQGSNGVVYSASWHGARVAVKVGKLSCVSGAGACRYDDA